MIKTRGEIQQQELKLCKKLIATKNRQTKLCLKLQNVHTSRSYRGCNYKKNYFVGENVENSRK